ncbi:MAG: radical SAM protein, partial [Bacteroidota bacterium]
EHDMNLPSYVQIEPVGQCNLRCQMCPIQFRQDGPPYGPLAFMEWDTFTSIIEGFDGLKHLHLQGLGEPMMHSRFFDMVRYATERGIRVTTNTNLTLLNPRRTGQLIESGLDTLHFSIDGSTAETYERIRKRARFDRVVANVHTLLETRERMNSLLPKLRLVMVIMRQNLHELPDLVRLAKDWSTEEVFVQHLSHDFGEPTLPENYAPMREFIAEQSLAGEDPERVQEYFGQARAAAESLGVKLRLPRTAPKRYPPGTPGRERCDWPWTGAYVSYEGYLMPCCMVSTPDRANFGKVTEHPLASVWDSSEYQGFRDRLDSDNPPDICKSCSLYWGTF